MCLTKVTKKFKPNDRIRIGYKIFTRNRVDGFGGQFYNTGYGQYKLGKECQASNSTLYDSGGKPYDSGFHCYSNLKEVLLAMPTNDYTSMCIVEVISWDIRCTGYQNRKKCFIAKNIRPVRVVLERGIKDLTYGKKWEKSIETLRTVIKLTKEGKTDKAYNLFIDLMTEGFKKYISMVAIIDRLNRLSVDFRILTKHHIKALSNKPGNKTYKEYFNKAVKPKNIPIVMNAFDKLKGPMVSKL